MELFEATTTSQRTKDKLRARKSMMITWSMMNIWYKLLKSRWMNVFRIEVKTMPQHENIWQVHKDSNILQYMIGGAIEMLGISLAVDSGANWLIWWKLIEYICDRVYTNYWRKLTNLEVALIQDLNQYFIVFHRISIQWWTKNRNHTRDIPNQGRKD